MCVPRASLEAVKLSIAHLSSTERDSEFHTIHESQGHSGPVKDSVHNDWYCQPNFFIVARKNGGARLH